MKIELPQSIVALIQQKYPPKLQVSATELLSDHELESEALREQVLRCIVLLAGRDLERLKHFLECAREDYRNLIYWQEHGQQALNAFQAKVERISQTQRADSDPTGRHASKCCK